MTAADARLLSEMISSWNDVGVIASARKTAEEVASRTRFPNRDHKRTMTARDRRIFLAGIGLGPVEFLEFEWECRK